MSTERDTHFQGSAELLAEKLIFGPLACDCNAYYYGDDASRLASHLIAQFLYDFARHVSNSVAVGHYTSSYVGMGEDADILDVDDLTEWPDNTHE